MGFNSGKANTLTSAQLPGPGRGDDAFAARRKIYEAGGDTHAGPVVAIGFERREERRRGAGEDGSGDRYTFTSLGMPGPDPTMMLSAVVPSICAAATLTPPRAAARTPGSAPARSRTCLCHLWRAGIGDDFRRVVLAGADDQVEHAIAINIPHRDIDAAFETRERDDRAINRSPLPSYRRTSAGLPGAREPPPRKWRPPV